MGVMMSRKFQRGEAKINGDGQDGNLSLTI